MLYSTHMESKPMYQYIFDMLEYADKIATLIQPGNSDNGNYFMTLIYIEDILDKYGRGLVFTSANEIGEDGHELMIAATQRMDHLRATLHDLMITGQYNDVLETRCRTMVRDWTLRSSES